MAILVLLEGKAKADAVDELTALLKQRLPETRAYDGCRDITPYLHDDGRTFVLVEHWDTKAHYEKYLAWRAETGVLAQLTEKIDGDPSIRYFDPVDA